MMSATEEKNEIVKKLSNYLKLPKVQRWICCEWFYSDIDKVIFESENDFSLCLKQSFPRLKTTNLRRKEWCILRSLIGKPRRCSDAFFREERHMLEEKRQKIRLVQQRKVSEKELVDFKDLPQEIPLTLSIGNRVYSHISYPEEGVFLGTIAAVDPCDHTYRVVFDRATIGSQTVYDYEIKSVTPVQTIPIKAYIQTYRPKITPNMTTNSQQSLIMLTPHKSLLTPNTQNLLLDDLNSININNPAFTSLLLQSDPMVGIGSPFKLGLDFLSGLNSQFQTPITNSAGIITNNLSVTASANGGGMLGGFPIRLLVMITRLNKILNIKKEFITKLSAMNTEAEKLRANNEPITKEFQTNYAILVLDLDKLNKDLSDYLNGVQRYCEDLVPGEFNKLVPASLLATTPNGENIINKPEAITKIEDLKQKLQNDSTDLVVRLNTDIQTEQINPVDEIRNNMNRVNLNETPLRKIKSKHLIGLITKLTNLLFQIREFIYATNRNSPTQSSALLPSCTRLINDSISEIKNSLIKESNIELFEDKVQVHINHIQSTLCHYNKLHAFKYEIDTNSTMNLLSSNDNLIECMSDDHDEDDDEEDDDEDDDENNENNHYEDNPDNDENCNEADDDVDDDQDENDLVSESENSYSNENLSTNLKKLKTKINKTKRKRLDKQSKTHLITYKKVLCSLSSPSSSSTSSSISNSKTNMNKKLHIGIST